MTKLVLAPLARTPALTQTTVVPSPEVQPALEPVAVNVNPLGSVSVIVKLVLGDGPLFVTVSW